MSSSYILPSDARAGSVYLSKNLDPTKDIVVSFYYACYGQGVSGSEGFCIFFINSVAGFLSGGGPGPGLCYTFVSNITATSLGKTLTFFEGVNRARLGVGFDITGNFGTSGYGVKGYANAVPDSIAIRGSQDTGYGLLYRSNSLSVSSTDNTKPLSLFQTATGLDQVDFYRVRLRLTDFCSRVVVDFIKPGETDYINYIDTQIPRVTWPTSVNCCLSFSSGLTETDMSIKNFNVNGVFTAASAAGISNTWTYSGANYFGQVPNPAVLTVRDTISVVNAPPWDAYPPLVVISTAGSAPFVNTDGYINITYT